MMHSEPFAGAMTQQFVANIGAANERINIAKPANHGLEGVRIYLDRKGQGTFYSLQPLHNEGISPTR
jgi:hypothetical protein